MAAVLRMTASARARQAARPLSPKREIQQAGYRAFHAELAKVVAQNPGIDPMKARAIVAREQPALVKMMNGQPLDE